MRIAQEVIGMVIKHEMLRLNDDKIKPLIFLKIKWKIAVFACQVDGTNKINYMNISQSMFHGL